MYNHAIDPRNSISIFTDRQKYYMISRVLFTFSFEKGLVLIMIKVGIIGATGYAGAELVRLLSAHKDAQIIWYGSRSYVGQEYAQIY